MNDREIINADVKYEAKDVSGAWLGAIGVLVVVMAIILPFLLWGFYGHFQASYGNGNRTSGAKSVESSNAPAAPDLKPNPVNSYGWIDRKKGVVHVPIDEAMKQLAERGLPVIQPANTIANVMPSPSPISNANSARPKSTKKR